MLDQASLNDSKLITISIKNLQQKSSRLCLCHFSHHGDHNISCYFTTDLTRNLTIHRCFNRLDNRSRVTSRGTCVSYQVHQSVTDVVAGLNQVKDTNSAIKHSW